MRLVTPKTPRSAAYLAFVRGMPCAVTGVEHGVIAHHVRMHPHGGGLSLKPSDYRVVPLNQMRHLELHQHGEKTFWKKYGVRPEAVMGELLRQWCAQRYLVDVPAPQGVDLCEYVGFLEDFIVGRGAGL